MRCETKPYFGHALANDTKCIWVSRMLLAKPEPFVNNPHLLGTRQMSGMKQIGCRQLQPRSLPPHAPGVRITTVTQNCFKLHIRFWVAYDHARPRFSHKVVTRQSTAALGASTLRSSSWSKGSPITGHEGPTWLPNDIKTNLGGF